MIFTAGKFGLIAELNPLRLELRSNLQEPDRWLVEYAGGHPTASGQTMTERTAMQLSAVFSAVNLIARAISTAPLCLYEQTGPDETREAVDHPLYKLLRWPPNEEMTKKTAWETFMGHLLLWGNGYQEIERDGAGRPIALWPLRPDRTFPRRKIGRDGKATGGLIYIARSSAGPEVELRPDQVFHVMGYSYDGLRGLSPVALHRESLGLSMAAGDYGARFFGNDASPGGVLTHPAKIKPEAAKRLKESWEEAHRGGDQAHRVALLEEGMKFEAIGMSNEDAQYLTTRIFQLSEVARMFNVPLHKLAELTHGTFSNIEHQSIEFIRDGVEPWACAIEEEIHRKLLNPVEQLTYYADHDFSAQKIGDMKSQNEAEGVAWDKGWTNTDEIRRRRHQNPLPNGQGKTYFVPVTQQPIDRALNPPEPAAAGNPGEDGKPPIPGGPKNPPAGANDAKAKRRHAQELAERRRQVALAFAPLLGSVGERLARKELAALQRKDSDPDSFFRDHFAYVRDAISPLMTCIEESVSTVLRMENYTAPIADREKFVGNYVDNFSRRYVKEALINHIAKAATWSNGVPNRAHEEAMRASNAFALHLYKAGGAKNVAWIVPDTGCDSECMSFAARFHSPDVVHPPRGARCECQIVAVDHV